MDLDLIKLADLMEGISREIKRVYGESPAAPAITAPQGQLDTPEQPESTEATTTETPNQQESKFADLEDAGTSVTAAESATPPAANSIDFPVVDLLPCDTASERHVAIRLSQFCLKQLKSAFHSDPFLLISDISICNTTFASGSKTTFAISD